MEGLLPLILATGIGGGFLYASAKRKQDGFQNLVQPIVARAMGPEHTAFVEKSQKKFNPIANLTNPLDLPFTTSQERSVQQALVPAKVSRGSEVQITPGNPTRFNIMSETESNTINAIRSCEKVREINCDAFDDPNFAYTCGICHEGGKDSGGNPTFGGLYVSEENKLNAEESAKNMGSRRVNYNPSVGSCATGRFTVTKEQCNRMKKQLECEKKQNFEIEGCSQCYQNEKFVYIDPNVIKSVPTMVFVGSGTLRLTKIGGETKIMELTDTPQKYEIPDFKEGDVVQLQIVPETGSIAGFLTGQTASGVFSIDIIRLIQTDSVSGQRPRMAGFMTINGESYTVIRPGRGKTSMNLSLQNVFTFIDIGEPEATSCSASPYITNSSSAEYLNSGPCFKKGSGPGKYSLECLQNTFVNAGCDANGSAYPSNAEKAQALMYQSGNSINIAQIADNVNKVSMQAYSGTANGNKLTIPQWNESSVWCLGKPINSPCDGDDKGNGPLSADCLFYLWQNKGAEDKNPGSVGPTYTNRMATTSLDENRPRFCTGAGTMSPVNLQGQYNQGAIAEANKKGGVERVKQFYNEIHYKANDNSLSDEARKAAIQQCYGVDLLPPPTNMVGGGNNFTTCEQKQIIDVVNGPTESKFFADVVIRKNWKLSFTIRPKAIHPNPIEWANVLVITGDETAYEGIASRIPGIWFWPNSTRLHVSMLTGPNGWWNIDTSVSLPLDVDTNVVITMDNGLLRMKTTGGVNEQTEGRYPVAQYTGPGKVYAPRHPWQSFLGQLRNVQYCSYEGVQSVLDHRPGRTKSAVQNVNYAPFDWSTASKPVAVMGSYGMAPWGTWWAPGFPDDGSAKWIWTFTSAQQNEPSWSFRRFFYRYTNTRNTSITATLTAAIDNTGSLHVNDNFIGNTTGHVTRWQITLPPGESKIEINAANQGGPAGMIAICKEGNTTLFATDSSWTTV
jgi:hypothetical protein